jgi:hypothetical protein
MRATALGFAVEYAGVLTEHDEGTMSPEDVVATAEVFLQFLEPVDNAAQPAPETDPNSVPLDPTESFEPVEQESAAPPVEPPPPAPPAPPPAPVPEDPAPVSG